MSASSGAWNFDKLFPWSYNHIENALMLTLAPEAYNTVNYEELKNKIIQNKEKIKKIK